jgi:zinc protease
LCPGDFPTKPENVFLTAATAGMSNFAARMLTRGTGKHTADEIAREMDMMAGGVSGFSGRNSIGLRGEFLSKYFERGMGMFLDCLADSRFPEAEIEKERPIVIEEIRNREDDLSALAFDLFAQTLYRTHPYRWDPLGTEKNVSSFRREGLLDFYKKHMVPANMTLVVTGDVIPAQVAAFVEERLGAWKPGDFSLARPAAEEPLKTPRTAYRYKEKEQAHIVLGFMGTTVRDPERHALEVLSTILAGQGGRLFLELRDKKSLAYAITSFALEGVDSGYFAVYMACAPDKVEVAVEAIREELKKIASEPVDPKELERAKNYLIGTQEISLQRNASKAAQMAFNEAYGLGWEETFKYAEKIAAVDAKMVQEVAKKYLDQSRYVLAIIRPQGKK